MEHNGQVESFVGVLATKQKADQKDEQENHSEKTGMSIDTEEKKEVRVGFLTASLLDSGGYRRAEWRLYTYLMNLMWSQKVPQIGPLAPLTTPSESNPTAELVQKIRNWLSTDATLLPDCFDETKTSDEQWAFLKTVAVENEG